MQYFPYFAHEGWLTTRFLPHAISYEGALLFDFIVQRSWANAIYLFVVVAPLLSSSNRDAQMFGLLISAVAKLLLGGHHVPSALATYAVEPLVPLASTGV